MGLLPLTFHSVTCTLTSLHTPLTQHNTTQLTSPMPRLHVHTHAHMPHHGYLVSVPGQVQNIKAVVDPEQASIRLSWDPPLNFEMPGGCTTYRIRFKPEGRSNYDEKTVTTNHVSLTRNSGLRASGMYTFEVRAQNAGAAGEWKGLSELIGKL